MKILVALVSVIALGAYAPALAQSSEAQGFESPVSTKELSESNFKFEESARAALGFPSLSPATSVAGNAPAAVRDTLKVRHEISVNPIQGPR
jgi:hypothetical protein